MIVRSLIIFSVCAIYMCPVQSKPALRLGAAPRRTDDRERNYIDDRYRDRDRLPPRRPPNYDSRHRDVDRYRGDRYHGRDEDRRGDGRPGGYGRDRRPPRWESDRSRDSLSRDSYNRGDHQYDRQREPISVHRRPYVKNEPQYDDPRTYR